MSHLYILQNNKNKYYVGITQLIPEERLVYHNKGLSPIKLINDN